LVGDDLAALFGLDMEESKAPAPSRSADATSAGLRKKTRKSVRENLAVAAAPAVETKANAVTPAQEKKAGSDKQGHRPTAKTSSKARSAQATQKKNTMAPTRSAAKKTVAAPTKSAAKSATAKPSAGIRKAQAKAHRVRSPPI
jgi:DNA-binding protein HU-beta